ncbi:MAG: L-rhamnose mutarotase [Fimbriimonadaceae bacterium]
MRVCFHLQVKPNRLDEYKRLHLAVWPEVLAELKSAGIRNYSLYLWEAGHEFGVLECDDWIAVQAVLGGSPVMARWEAFMADFLATPVTPGAGPRLLEEVFRLE